MHNTKQVDGVKMPLTDVEQAAFDAAEAAHNHPDAVALRASQVLASKAKRARGPVDLEKIWDVLKAKGLVGDADLLND
jgi:hypothetical protein